MNIVPIVKAVTGLATSIGVGAVVGNAIKATTPIVMSRTQKVIVTIGGVALSAVAGDMVATNLENQIDEIVLGYRAGKAVKDGFKQAAADADAREASTPDESN